MDYQTLFNLLYSTEISEATKDEIISKIGEPIEESAEVDELAETYMELLDTLVFSTASEELIDNIIEETFSSLDEEFINEVSDEWVKRKVQGSMAARRAAADSANKSVKSGVIGLSQIRRQDKAQQDLAKGEAKSASIQARLDKKNPNPQSKAEGALGKLKSAVGKVKKWASPEGNTAPVGLSRIIGAKANKDNIGANALHNQTAHKASSASQAETPKEDTEATRRANKITAAKEKAKGTKLPAGEEPIEMENSQIKKRKAAIERAKGHTLPAGDKPIEMENPETKERRERIANAQEKAKGHTLPAGDKPIEMGTSKKRRGRPRKENKPEVKAEGKPQEVKTEGKPAGEKPKRNGRRQRIENVVQQASNKTKGNKQSEVKAEEVKPAENKTEETPVEKPKRNKRQNAKKAAQEVPNETKEEKSEVKAEEVKPAENKTEEVKSEVKTNDATKAVEGNKTNTPKVETPKNQSSAKIKSTTKTLNAKKTVANAITEPEGEKPAEEKVEQKPQKSAWERQLALLKREAVARDKDIDRTVQSYRDRMNAIKSSPDSQSSESQKEIEELQKNIDSLLKKRSTKVTEALSDLAILLLNTNISESCFVEVMEMAGANKENALKVKDRYEHDMSAVLNDLNKELEEKKSIDPESLKKAEELAKRKDHFEEMFNKKFNNNN